MSLTINTITTIGYVIENIIHRDNAKTLEMKGKGIGLFRGLDSGCSGSWVGKSIDGSILW